jgi:hypothetical protein
MKLTEREIDFLTRVRDGRPLRIADRPEDRARQRMSKAKYAECVMGPRRWVITDAGLAALSEGGDT